MAYLTEVFAGKGKSKKKEKKTDYIGQSIAISAANRPQVIREKKRPLVKQIKEEFATLRSQLAEQGLTDRTQIGEQGLTDRTGYLTGAAVDIAGINADRDVGITDIQAYRDVAIEGDKGELANIEAGRQYDLRSLDYDAERERQLLAMERQQYMFEQQQMAKDADLERRLYEAEMRAAQAEAMAYENELANQGIEAEIADVDLASDDYSYYSEEPSVFSAFAGLFDGNYSGPVDPFATSNDQVPRIRPLHRSGVVGNPKAVVRAKANRVKRRRRPQAVVGQPAGTITWDGKPVGQVTMVNGVPVKTMVGAGLTQADLSGIRQMQAGLNPAALGLPASNIPGRLPASIALTGTRGFQEVAGNMMGKACCDGCASGGTCASGHQHNKLRRVPRKVTRCMVKAGGTCQTDILPESPVEFWDGRFQDTCAGPGCDKADAWGGTTWLGVDRRTPLPALRAPQFAFSMAGRCSVGQGCRSDLSRLIRWGGCSRPRVVNKSDRMVVGKVLRRVSPLLDL